MPLPLDPLLRHSGLSRRAFRDRVRTYTKTLDRAERYGLNVELADLWSCRLDVHPAEVYGIDTWLEALAEEDATCSS